MALFGRKKTNTNLTAPQDPKWVHGEGGRFPRFLDLDPEAAGLKGLSGVFAVWHTGVKPGWVYVGASKDLEQTFYKLGEDKNVLEYRDRGNLYCSWCLIREEFQAGVVAFLTLALKPKVNNPDAPDPDTHYKDLKIDMIPVYAPGMEPKDVNPPGKLPSKIPGKLPGK